MRTITTLIAALTLAVITATGASATDTITKTSVLAENSTPTKAGAFIGGPQSYTIPECGGVLQVDEYDVSTPEFLAAVEALDDDGILTQGEDFQTPDGVYIPKKFWFVTQEECAPPVVEPPVVTPPVTEPPVVTPPVEQPPVVEQQVALPTLPRATQAPVIAPRTALAETGVTTQQAVIGGSAVVLILAGSTLVMLRRRFTA